MRLPNPAVLPPVQEVFRLLGPKDLLHPLVTTEFPIFDPLFQAAWSANQASRQFNQIPWNPVKVQLKLGVFRNNLQEPK